MVKNDGTVWGTGDYAHGDEDIRSKTKGVVPIQIGNDETGFSQTEITVEVGDKKNIATNTSYEFNLIYLNQDFNEELTFNSLKDEIAELDENGNINGIRIGTTRVNAVSKKTGKVYSILVKVVDRGSIVAPKVCAGENFVGVLKSDGSIWTFGYNTSGQLATGDYLTYDKPTKTNILSTYSDIKVGDDFLVALRLDGTVWTSGNNNDGQLGDR